MVYYANLKPEHISWDSIFYEVLHLIRFYISYNRFYGEYSEVYAWIQFNLAGDNWYRQADFIWIDNISDVKCLLRTGVTLIH